MNPINILFFVLASFMGMEDARIVSRKVSVTFNPATKTIEIAQEDLFSIIVMPEDSVAVVNELQRILVIAQHGEKAGENGFTIEKVSLHSSNLLLNADIQVSYTDPESLEKAGIGFDAATGFSMINIPDWNIRSSTAVLEGNYWTWPPDKPVTFVMEAFEHLPEGYAEYRRSILPFWDRLQTTGYSSPKKEN
ncbi:hypothetical protein [Parapedobacter lycopersici]|uniref:hypothetical protein n=1 Tax=Parapedobacter lycopersici TaxID=1864939 RepID=UPI00334083A3